MTRIRQAIGDIDMCSVMLTLARDRAYHGLVPVPAIRGGNSVALDPDSKGVIGKQAVAQAVPASLPGVASTAICLMVAASHGPPMIVHCHTPAGRVEYQENRACMNIRTCFIGPFPVVVIKGRDVWCLTRAGRVPV